MTKTGKDVQTDVYNLLKNSALASKVSGGVYRNGYRPRNSGKEDIVVTFTAGMTGDIQTGVVTVNIFVPDISPYAGNGVLVEDGARTAELERAAQSWVDSLKTSVSNYKFALRNAIYTSHDSIADEHFVVVRIGYSYYD